MKKEIKVSTEIDWLCDMEDIDALILKLEEVKLENHGATHICIEEEWTGYEDVEYHVVVTRLETEEEFTIREHSEFLDQCKQNDALERAKVASREAAQGRIFELKAKIAKIETEIEEANGR